MYVKINDILRCLVRALFAVIYWSGSGVIWLLWFAFGLLVWLVTEAEPRVLKALDLGD